MVEIDVLLIGQGLAGSLLAWELCQRQFRVLVIDNGLENASQVAAGLINPVTGQRLVKQPEVDEFLPTAMACYQQLEQLFRQRFYTEMPMLKILRNDAERRLAERRLREPGYREYLSECVAAPDALAAPWGVLQQRQTGYLRTEAILDSLRNFLQSQSAYRRCDFRYDEIETGPALRWRDSAPTHIVFCEGYRGSTNPWFRALPFQLAKGEILGCESQEATPKRILNYGHWLIPIEERRFKTGATFDTRQVDTHPTQSAQTTLLDSLASVCPKLRSLNVFQHRAGIRPATLDKQPFIGTHPRFGNLHIFNGFGAKGSLAIPWHAARFADYLQRQVELPLHCDIRRYDDTYFPAWRCA